MATDERFLTQIDRHTRRLIEQVQAYRADLLRPDRKVDPLVVRQAGQLLDAAESAIQSLTQRQSPEQSDE